MRQFLLLAAAALALPAAAQTLKPAQVPAAARATFQAKFPAATAHTWEKEGDKYEAGFQLKGKTMSALLTPAGELLETETGLLPAQLPAAVRAQLASHYAAYKIREAAIIVRADGSTVYEAEVSQGGRVRDVLFHADGSLAK